MKNIIKLIRLHQYVKNLFIFLPIFFAGSISNIELLVNSIVAFIAFSISASSIYILNDYLDIKEDSLHPIKKHRPLASGNISKKNAILLMSILFVIGISMMAILSKQAFVVLVTYIVLNIAYSFYLKHIAILDVVIIAIGFVLRLFVGSVVSDVVLSMWIVMMTFLLALFMALAKRRDDLLLYSKTGKKMRSVIDGYNLALIDSAMMIFSSVVIVTYILYTTSTEVITRIESDYLYLTTIFVILGIMRYLKITLVYKDSGSPTKIILKDRFIQLSVLGWIVSFTLIIYL